MEANRKFLKLLYEHVNKEKCDLDHQEFFELIEMHMIVFIMSLKRFFRDGESRTEASEYYKRHIHMLHYGICGYKTGQQEENRRGTFIKTEQPESYHSSMLQKMRRNHEESR